MERSKTLVAALAFALVGGCGGAGAEPETSAEQEQEDDDSHFPEDAMDHYEGGMDEDTAGADDPIDDEAVDVTDDEL